MRILLTGGTRFIGSYVADHLLALGHEVAIVDDFSSGSIDKVPEDTRFYELDVRPDCGEVFEEFRPEAIVHQAAQINLRCPVREPAFDAEVNVLGTLKLLENCARYGVGKVVFASTGGAIYRQESLFPAAELSAGEASTINGRGEQIRDYVYVKDVAWASIWPSKRPCRLEHTTSAPESRRA